MSLALTPSPLTFALTFGSEGDITVSCAGETVGTIGVYHHLDNSDWSPFLGGNTNHAAAIAQAGTYFTFTERNAVGGVGVASATVAHFKGNLVPGTYTLPLYVESSLTGTSPLVGRHFTLTVIVSAPPALVITSPAAITGTVGEPVSYTITANRALADHPATLTAPGATFLALAGNYLVQGTPTVPGTYPFTVRAEGLVPGGPSATRDVTLTVSSATTVGGGGGGGTAGGVAISDATKAAATITLDDVFSRELVATGGGIERDWSISGAPDWLTLTGPYGPTPNLSGTPPAAGQYNLVLRVAGSDGTTDAAALRITVTAAGDSGEPPVFSPGSYDAGFVATVGEPFALGMITRVDSHVTSNAASGLPDWLTFSPAAGGAYAYVHGTPTTAAGEVTITLSATNSHGTTTIPARITVRAVVPPPVLDGPFYVLAPAGQPFFYNIASTPQGATFAAAGLPDGLALHGQTISGTPLPGAAGQSAVSLTATDAQGRRGSATLVIEVTRARNYPAAGSGAAPYAPEELCFFVHSETKQGLLRDFTARTTRPLGTFLRNEGVPYAVRLVQESRTNYRTFDDVDPTGAEVRFAIGNAEETPWVATSSTTPLPAADFTLEALRAGTERTTAVQRLTLLHHPYDGTFEFEGRAIPHDATGEEFTAALGSGWNVVSGGAHTWDITRTRPGAYGPSAVDISGVIVPVGFLVEFDFDTEELIAAFEATEAESIEGTCEGSFVRSGESLPHKFFRQSVAIARSVLDPTQPTPSSVAQYPPANQVPVRATDAEAAAGISTTVAMSVAQTAAYVAAHASAPRILAPPQTIEEAADPTARTLRAGETVVLIGGAGWADADIPLLLPDPAAWGATARVLAVDGPDFFVFLGDDYALPLVARDAGAVVTSLGQGVWHVSAPGGEVAFLRTETTWTVGSGALASGGSAPGAPGAPGAPRVARVETSGDDATASIGGSPYATAQAAFDDAFDAAGQTQIACGIGSWAVDCVDIGWPARIVPTGAGRTLSTLNVSCTGAADVTMVSDHSIHINASVSGTLGANATLDGFGNDLPGQNGGNTGAVTLTRVCGTLYAAGGQGGNAVNETGSPGGGGDLMMVTVVGCDGLTLNLQGGYGGAYQYGTGNGGGVGPVNLTDSACPYVTGAQYNHDFGAAVTATRCLLGDLFVGSLTDTPITPYSSVSSNVITGTVTILV